MKRILIPSLLALSLAGGVSALDLGVGASLSNNNYNYDSDGDYSYGYNTFSFTLTGTAILDNGVEVDPYFSFTEYTENDSDDATTSYDDEEKTTSFLVGADVLFSLPSVDKIRLLGGVGAAIGGGSRDYEGMTADYSRFQFRLSVPVAAELKVVPQFGLRVGGNLAALSVDSRTYSYDAGGDYVNLNTDFALFPSNLSLGAFFYF